MKFNTIRIGIIAIRSKESGRLTPKQLESIRLVTVRITKRTGKL